MEDTAAGSDVMWGGFTRRAATAAFAVAVFSGVLVAGAGSAGAASSVWTSQNVPIVANMLNTLTAISCPSTSFCAAVGRIDVPPFTNSDTETLAEMWDGSSWHRASTPNPQVPQSAFPTDQFDAVSCTSSSFCVAVGSQVAATDSGPSTSALAEMWNGASWSVMPTTSISTSMPSSSLSSVSCRSATACVAVGSGEVSFQAQTLIAVWNGTDWARVASPNEPGDNVLAGVSCVSAVSCAAVGTANAATLVLGWNGASWSVESSPNPSFHSTLSSVSCASSTRCIAVGSWDEGSMTHALIESFDGTKWSVSPTPQLDTIDTLNAVSCVSATDCTAIGGYGERFPDFALIEAWNGTSWSVSTLPPLVPSFIGAGISCPNATSCAAVSIAGWGIGNAPSSAPMVIAGSVGPVPDAPGNASATPGFRSATVSWVAPNDHGSPITGYKVTAYPGQQQTFAPAGQTSAVVRGLADGVTYSFTVSAANSVGQSAEAFSNTVTTPDAVSIGDASVLEGDAGVHKLVFPVTLSRPATTTVSVSYAIDGSDATGGTKAGADVDFKALSGTVTFAPSPRTGMTAVEKVVAVPVYGDTTVEPDETVTATLTNPIGGDYVVGRSVGTGTILNDDGNVATTVGVGDATIVRSSSGNEVLRVPVTLSAPAAGASVTFSVTTDGASYSKSARGGGDFGGKLTGTITFAKRSTSKMLSIPIWPKATSFSEQLVVTLTDVNGTGISVIRSTGTATIALA